MAQETDERLVNVAIASTEADILRDRLCCHYHRLCCGDRERCLAFECTVMDVITMVVFDRGTGDMSSSLNFGVL